MAGTDSTDPSNGYEAVANGFISGGLRSSVGASAVRAWAKTLPKGAVVLTVFCDTGERYLTTDLFVGGA